MVICRIGIAAVLLSSAIAYGQTQRDVVDADQLSARYSQVWDAFVKEFRAEPIAKKKLDLIDVFSEKANDVLAAHLTSDEILEVLPKLENAKLLKLGPTFLAIIKDHPERKTRAQALLSMGHYLGHNRRFEECDVTLAHLKSAYDELPFGRDGTFGKAADHFRYFYKHLAVGRTAPSAAGEDVDGGLFRLSDYNGKVVMLRFWGDWCPPCRAMYDYERDVVKKFSGRPFALVGVNSDPKERCRQAQIDNQLVWRSFWDGGSTTGPISQVFQVTQWPTIVVIDSQGVIRMRTKGLNREYLTEVLDRLVRETEESATKGS